MTTIERVAIEDWPGVVECILSAFSEDPVANYIVQNESAEKRPFLLRQLFTGITKAHLLKGEIYKIGDFESVALWLPPGGSIGDIWTTLRSGLWKLYFQFSKESRIRFFDEFSPLLMEEKQRALGDDDARAWYLVFLATNPAYRGKGNGRRLIEHVASDDTICYLESSNALNLPLYERTGFKRVSEFELKRASKPIKLYPMIKPASKQK